MTTRVRAAARSSSANRLNPRKMARQSRAEATVEAILTAAAHILVVKGFAKLNTNAVAERAGVSIGSLYQYFPGKEALVAELMRRHVSDIDAILSVEFRLAMQLPLAAAAQRLVRANIAAHQVDPALHRALFTLDPGLLPNDLSQPIQSTIPRITALLEQFRDELLVTDLKLAAFVAYQLVESCTHAAIVDGLLTTSPARLETEITQALIRYLVGER